MRPVLTALILLAIAPAAAPAAGPPFGTYPCWQTLANYGPTGIPSFYTADRGVIGFNFDDEGETSSYDYDASFLEREARAGGWSWDGARATFDSGPLARPDEGWSVEAVWASGSRMPHDTVPGRTWPLLVRSLTATPADEAPASAGQEGQGGFQQSYWYCGTTGTQVRRAVGTKLRGYIAREADVPVRLPKWMPIGVSERVRPKLLVLTGGYYRLEMGEAILSAKRAPASDLGVRRRVKLGRGITGSVGNYGCAFNGTDPDWGPRYCGRIAIVWHQAGVNHCIEVVGNYIEADLVRAARQAVRAN